MTDNGDMSSPTQAAASASVHAASPARFGREDVVRAGRAGSAWEYVPFALAALRLLPDDAEIRFLLAAAYAKLGLRTAALEQIERLPETVQHDPGVAALRDATRGLLADRVGVDELDRTLRANLAAIARREDAPDGLSERYDAWRERASKHEHFRTRTGDRVWRLPGDTCAWVRLDSQREQAGLIRLPHDESPTATTYPTWYAVDGFDPPWMLLRVWRSTGTRADGFAPYVLAAQRDHLQALDGLAQHDLSEVFSDPRVRLFVGPSAGATMQQFLSTRSAAGIRIACAAVGLPTTIARIEPAIAQMTDLATRDAERAERDLRDVCAGTPARSREFWAERFRDVGTPAAEPLRVLIPTSRFSTFLRHSAADLADALNAAGCEASVFMEPDDHSLLEPLASLRACREHRPDLIVIPNYTRASVASRFPADIPLVTWVQDSMPHLYEKDAGTRLSELDFVAGNLREEMFQHFGYPRSRALHTPMAASARKFHPGPVPSAIASRHACDIAYVSHHSQTPQAMHERKVAEAASAPGVGVLLERLFDRIMGVVDSPISRGPLTRLLADLTREEVRRAGLPADEPAIAGALTAYVHPIADRALRHRTLKWAAAIAARRTWRLHLYGKGWETHPTLALHAQGELAHGEDLRACYHTARAHLHISLHTAVHQRVFECAMSGGLPICRLQADDLSQLEYLAAAHACRAGAEPEASEPGRVASMGYRIQAYRTDACDESRRYARFVEAMGLDAPKFAWLNSIHAERLRSSPEERIDGVGESLWDLWPDPAALMFHNEQTLERVLERAVEDAGWRERHARDFGDRARAVVTYDAFAKRVVRFVADGLATSGGNPGARWYDTPEGRSTGPAKRPITPI